MATFFAVLVHQLFYVGIGAMAWPVIACSLAAAIITFILAWSNGWPGRVLVFAAPSFVAATLFACLLAPILFLAAAPTGINGDQYHINFIGKWLYLIVPLASFLGLSLIASRAIFAVVNGVWRWLLSIVAVAVLGAVIVPNAMANSLVSQGHAPGLNPSDLFASESFIEALPELLRWAFVALTLIALYSIQELPSRRPEIRRVGVAILLVLLFSDGYSYYYVPVTLVLGYLALDRVALPAHLAGQRADRRSPAEAIRYALGAWHRAELASNQREHLTDGSADALRDILMKDGTDGYNRSYDALTRTQYRLDERYGRLRSQAYAAADAAFDHKGRLPDTGAARVGFLVGLVWTAMTIAIQLLAARPFLPFTSYPDLDFFRSNGANLFLWPLLGWCIGYFLPFIRGKEGVTKALWLALPVVAAAVPLELLWDDAACWLNVLVFDLELFSFLVVASVAVGDLLVLQRAGMRLADWVRVHNWKFVVSWSSAVLAALATAAATFLSTAATDVSNQTVATVTAQNTTPHVGHGQRLISVSACAWLKR